MDGVRAGERRGVARVLEPAASHQRVRAVEQQRAHGEHGNEAEDEQDQDLAPLAGPARNARRHQWFTSIVLVAETAIWVIPTSCGTIIGT